MGYEEEAESTSEASRLPMQQGREAAIQVALIVVVNTRTVTDLIWIWIFLAVVSRLCAACVMRLGWTLRDFKTLSVSIMDLSASRGVALSKNPTEAIERNPAQPFIGNFSKRNGYSASDFFNTGYGSVTPATYGPIPCPTRPLVTQAGLKLTPLQYPTVSTLTQ